MDDRATRRRQEVKGDAVNAREFLAELKKLQEDLSHGRIYDEVGDMTYTLLSSIMDGTVKSFELALKLREDMDDKFQLALKLREDKDKTP